MKRLQTLVQLTEDLVATLDARALREGTSRSELIRRLLAQQLAEDRRAEMSRRMAEGYQRAPQADAEVDAWGDLAAWNTANARRNAASLRDEEAARPW
jgi:hypothetical protein